MTSVRVPWLHYNLFVCSDLPRIYCLRVFWKTCGECACHQNNVANELNFYIHLLSYLMRIYKQMASTDRLAWNINSLIFDTFPVDLCTFLSNASVSPPTALWRSNRMQHIHPNHPICFEKGTIIYHICHHILPLSYFFRAIMMKKIKILSETANEFNYHYIAEARAGNRWCSSDGTSRHGSHLLGVHHNWLQFGIIFTYSNIQCTFMG